MLAGEPEQKEPNLRHRSLPNRFGVCYNVDVLTGVPCVNVSLHLSCNYSSIIY